MVGLATLHIFRLFCHDFFLHRQREVLQFIMIVYSFLAVPIRDGSLHVFQELWIFLNVLIISFTDSNMYCYQRFANVHSLEIKVISTCRHWHSNRHLFLWEATSHYTTTAVRVHIPWLFILWVKGKSSVGGFMDYPKDPYVLFCSV